MISLNMSHGWGPLIFWFVLFTLATFVTLMSFAPAFVSSATVQPTPGFPVNLQWTLIYSALIALGLMVVAYVANRY